MLRFLLSVIFIALALPALAADFVRVEGKRFIAPDGKAIQLKGINLGNWLMPEGYMFKFERAKAPRQIENAIERIVGAEAAQRFWRTYRETYITEDDFAFIKSAGFNLVRIPLHYRHFVRGDRFEGEGYALLDRAVGWAKAHGLMWCLTSTPRRVARPASTTMTGRAIR